MPPDASRLVYRIKTALKGESGGQETAKLAWQYAAAVEAANREARECAKLLARSEVDAYVRMETSPKLLDTLDALDFPERGDWIERCQLFRWRQPEALDHEAAQPLRELSLERDNPKEWLFGEYRTRMRRRESLSAYPIISLLAQLYPEEANIQEERRTQSERLQERAQKEVATAAQELIAADSVPAVLARYREAGVPLGDGDDALQAALQAEAAAQTKQAETQAQAVVDREEELDQTGDWQAIETQYLECDYLLGTTGARASMDPALRDRFNQVATTLARKRVAFETEILIRRTIASFRQLMDGGKTESAPSGKPLNKGDILERLRSQESQAQKMGYRLSPDLRRELDEVYSELKRRRFPKYVIALGSAAVIALASFLIVSRMQEEAVRQDRIQRAAEALAEADQQDRFEPAQQALARWEELAQQAEAESALSQSYQALRSWMDEQQSLQNRYVEIVARLNEAQEQGLEDLDAAQVERLLIEARQIEGQLAPDLARAQRQAKREFLAWRARSIEQRERILALEFDRALKSAIDHLERARGARSSQAFQTEADAADQALLKAQSVLTAASGPLPLEDRSPPEEIKQVRSSLQDVSRKWSTLIDLQRRLSQSGTLDQYLENLSRIQSFDITPRLDKSAISRVLRLESELDSLLRLALLPEAPEAWIELARPTAYRQEKPEVTDVERVFLERLANDESFVGIYKSRVQYFEGEASPKNEYTVLLQQPISKDQVGLKTGVNFSFSVQGFDEFGDPESSPREMNFLSRPDGTFWGFFYRPSELSQESTYYEETLRLSLLQILSGAPRFTLLSVIDELNQRRTLSPAFRAYWQEQLFTFMEMNPWKWGVPLSPSLQEQIKELKSISRGGISKQQWLSSVEQTAPSLEYTEYFRKAYKRDLTEEAAAMATLYETAMEGDFVFLGFADAEGQRQLAAEPQSGEALWSVNKLTGRIEEVDAQAELAPYAPILAYRYEGQPATRLIQSIRLQTGLDLTAEPLADHLPPLVKANN